ncbi:twin-arginine translocase TatA/TatE family subunit [Pontiella agarivorans]|uniref:Sec-independent protein translocase protein TatA n=1 Tax=Pontiella agarivorans TaxID=3038953 RepID=A0ABU5MSK0_9BACT|nr:twin-arginine translocase TatA/TatE family subunit [Pontiella agarivorans]MDZ8117175.1 twin-arginine translocase TatA/TatE family subunit [Pontiella agarivorans]
MQTLAIGMPGGPELLVILFIVLLLFGAKKLPELSRSLGKSLGEFKKGQKEGTLPDSSEDEVEKQEISSSDEDRKE